jgi:hypothetical protein
MPEWGTKPANHYLPRRRTQMKIHSDVLQRADNPLKIDGLLPKPRESDPSLDDVMSRQKCGPRFPVLLLTTLIGAGDCFSRSSP